MLTSLETSLVTQILLLAESKHAPSTSSVGACVRVCAVCRVPCAVRRAPCAVRRAPCAVRRAPCAVRRAPCAVRRAPCAVRRAPCAVRRAPCAVRRAPCDVCCALCVVCCVLWADVGVTMSVGVYLTFLCRRLVNSCKCLYALVTVSVATATQLAGVVASHLITHCCTTVSWVG